ncbi:MAG: hypothetical protein ABI336_00900, partial [Humibacillus sp.]
ERVTGWQRTESGSAATEAGPVWTVEVPHALFGEFNPFAEEVVGDWVVRPIEEGHRKHLGEVYLEGRSFYEVGSLEDVAGATRREEVREDWTARPVPASDPDQTAYVWHARVGEQATTARSASGSTGRPRAPASRATSSTATPATSSSRSATAPTSSTTTSSPRRSPSSRPARAVPTSATSSAARSASPR